MPPSSESGQHEIVTRVSTTPEAGLDSAAMNPGGSQTEDLERASPQSSAPTAVQPDGDVVRSKRAAAARARSESVPRDSSSPRSGTAQAPIVVGDCIAERYDVLSVLGEGGMGIVYRCSDRHRGVDVALKQVTVPEGSSTRDYLAWFYKEARALATLDHPGIVHATDFGQLLGGAPYLVMEFVMGVSLHDLGHAHQIAKAMAFQYRDAVGPWREYLTILPRP